MAGLKQYTPPSMKGLNYNIDADLIFTTLWSSITGVSYIERTIGVSPRIIMNTNDITLAVTNAVGDQYRNVFTLMGGDIPYLDMLNRRIYRLGIPTTDLDAAPVVKMWTSWTPTETWVTATPESITKVGRYTQIGKVVYFEYLTVSSDSNATTGLSFTGLPGTMVTTINYATFSCWERAGAGGAIWYPCVAVLNKTTGVCTIANFTTATDGQLIWVAVQGHYEVS